MYDEDYPIASSIKLLFGSLENNKRTVQLFFDKNQEIKSESISY